MRVLLRKLCFQCTTSTSTTVHLFAPSCYASLHQQRSQTPNLDSIYDTLRGGGKEEWKKEREEGRKGLIVVGMHSQPSI